ncbi:MAG: 2-oxoacid:acceptor oxidoreductase subunit alpha [Methanomicrobiales archaeon]|nr:2-oxoacid:acceptor oxidoreductase subunit alpha [Methanomicrobiales archaeon]
MLIGGRAGEGLNRAGQIIARLLNAHGYHIYMYYDYPSLIRGGHNFSIIRAATHSIGAHRTHVDVLLALNRETLILHSGRLREGGAIIYDSDAAKADGIGIPLSKILKEEGAPPITRNSGLIGAFARAAGIQWEVLERIIKKEFPKGTEINLKVARRGFDASEQKLRIDRPSMKGLPLVSGNEAIGLGLLRGGLTSYIAYPMTPTSSLLHFLAEVEGDFGLKVVHPENEIAVMLMAIGAACGGEKVAVGTSGGGFCLMTEGLGFAGMAECPVVIVLGQRTGPSTGLPTYTSQGDLLFARHASQGEFSRLVTAPADASEAFFWSSESLRLAWRFQIPAIILSDKTLSEGYYSLMVHSREQSSVEESGPGNEDRPYRRYRFTDSGVSPMAKMPTRGAVVKVNSYYHDEDGITTEDAAMTASMQEKLLRKGEALSKELGKYETVWTHGRGEDLALVCWGSNGPVCQETADILGARVVRPIVLHPFPEEAFGRALGSPAATVVVEQNATAQLSSILKGFGHRVDATVLKYDGRPFSVEELATRVQEVHA